MLYSKIVLSFLIAISSLSYSSIAFANDIPWEVLLRLKNAGVSSEIKVEKRVVNLKTESYVGSWTSFPACVNSL